MEKSIAVLTENSSGEEINGIGVGTLSIISHLHDCDALDCCSVDCRVAPRAEQSNG